MQRKPLKKEDKIIMKNSKIIYAPIYKSIHVPVNNSKSDVYTQKYIHLNIRPYNTDKLNNKDINIDNKISIQNKKICSNKMAVLLCGIHYQENFVHWSGQTQYIDFRYYIKNLKKYIYDYFNESYSIDTFICTNNSDIQNDLLNTYNPVSYFFTDENKHTKILKIFELLFNTYDQI
jgi:hypothetical protein